LGCWGAGYQNPWLVLTDLPPQAATLATYQFLMTSLLKAGKG
jgi:hypothetical protein